jgi:GntR family transcriptional regulator of vanillate catabolism
MSSGNLVESVEPSSSSQQINALLRLRELLLNGEFTPGQRLREIPLVKRLKVSRTPLRLALTALQHEGLVEMNPRRGFVVRSFRLADIYEAIDIRGMLEGMAARLAVERLPVDPARAKASLAPLRNCVADLDRALASSRTGKRSGTAGAAGPFAHYVELNERLHTALLELAQSDTLSREMQRVSCLPFAAPSSGFVRMQAEIPESWKVLHIAQDQHHAILDAITAREAARAENLLREHARLVRRNLEIAINDHRVHHLVPGLRLIKDVAAASRGQDTPDAS